MTDASYSGSPSSTTGAGQQAPVDSASDVNKVAFLVRQMVSRLETVKLVSVMAVHGGGVAASGTVDVHPLVNQVDGSGNSQPHGTVYGLLWSRVQGGKNAVICDPEVGDIGWVVVSDRDISNVKSSWKQSNPGSNRSFDLADGVYAGGGWNVTPTQYLIFTSTGVRLVDLNGNSLAMGNTGITWTDMSGNIVASTSLGITLIDVSGNQMQMRSGFINMVTPVLQVNGVPVTVP